MAKYYLIASYYNAYTRSYHNQTKVKLENIDLSTIQAIDHFTSSYDKIDILTRINKEMNVEEINHLAIMYIKDENHPVDYYPIIEKNTDFSKIKKEIETDISYKNNKPKINYRIKSNQSSTYINNEFEKILRILRTGNIDDFKKLYPYQDDLYNLVNRYLNFYSNKDGLNEEDERARLTDLAAIKKEFLNYITFRKWIIAEQKRQNRYIIRPNRQQIQPQQPQQQVPRKKITNERKTVEQYEEEFIKEYEEKNKIGWKKDQIISHNHFQLEEEKEEYLEEHEYDMMYEEFKQAEPTPMITPKRKRR